MKNHPFLIYTPWFLALAALAGCSSGPACGDPHPYTHSANGPVLKAPPGLTLPAPDPVYVIPHASTPAPAAATGWACMIAPPNLITAPAAATVQKAGPAIITTPKPATAVPPAAATHTPPPVAAGRPME